MLGYLTYFINGLYLLYLIYNMFTNSKANKEDFRLILHISITSVLCLILPLFASGDSSHWFNMTLAVDVMLYYVFLLQQFTKRDSLTKALNLMGFKTQKDSGLAISQWQNELKCTFEKAMIEAGYEREYMGNTEKHMCLIQFKVKKQNEELAEKNENLSEQNKKLAEENARWIQESRLALLEINKRQNECDDREKRLKETAELLYQADQEQQARELELRRRERRARADEVYDRMVGDQYKQDSSRRMPDNLPEFGM